MYIYRSLAVDDFQLSELDSKDGKNEGENPYSTCGIFQSSNFDSLE